MNGGERAPHLQSAPEPERRNSGFIANDNDVIRVLGNRYGNAAKLYGVLSTAWYEYASPEKARERERKGYGRPGDFVALSVATIRKRIGNHSIDSITRWTTQLEQTFWECPWGCKEQHPLIVVKRGGYSGPNQYRKWRCGEDKPVRFRTPIRRPRKPKVAQEVDLLTNGAVDTRETFIPTTGKKIGGESTHLHSEDRKQATTEIGKKPLRPSESVHSEPRNHQEYSQDIPNRTATDPQADAVDLVSDVDVLAFNIVAQILNLARRREPDYDEGAGWDVARKLAASVLSLNPSVESAQNMLQRAVEDPRLERAENAIGLLIRGVVGDKNGGNRYLLTTAPAPVASGVRAPAVVSELPPGLHELLVRTIRDNGRPSAEWLRERGIPDEACDKAMRDVVAHEEQLPDSLPLCRALEASDPAQYVHRLSLICATLPLPDVLQDRRRLESPMIRGMCRAALELELQKESGANA